MKVIQRKQRGFVGPTSIIAMGLAVVVFSIPSYSNYTKRTRIGEGLVLSSAHKSAVTDYYVNNDGKWPTGTSDEIRQKMGMLPFESTSNTQSITIEKNGVIKITYTQKVQRDGVIYLEPSEQKNSDKFRIVWRCYSNNMKRANLPAECR